MNLKCWFYGHDTQGWEIIPDRFFSRQYAPDPHGARYGKPHKMVPTWFLFFNHGDRGWHWEKQECRCKRCGKLFWEAELIPLGETTTREPYLRSQMMNAAIVLERIRSGSRPAGMNF